ncbi:MAG: MalY/PatB family protein [Bacillota bacterium]|nr:MalY/PatB family protein [Bacillota bacterium]
MSAFDFNTMQDRKGTHSLKWDFAPHLTGAGDLLPMWVADMDFACAPVIVDAVSERATHGIYGYTGISDEYRSSVVYWMQQRHHWTIQPEWIVVITGIVPALNMLMQAFAQAGDQVLVQPPVYYPFFNAVRNNGQQLVLNTLKEENNRYVVDFDDLEQKLKDPKTTIMILCSPHNPVGRVWSREELHKMAQLCLENDVLLVSDEIHHDLVFYPHHHLATASLSDEIAANTITCTAPSKTFNLAGLQSSNIIISDEKKRRRFQQALDRNGVFGINPFADAATIAAYRHGAPWVDELLKYLSGNLDLVAACLEKEMPQIKMIRPEGTYLAWLDFRSLDMSPASLQQFMEEKAGVIMNQGPIFGETGAGFQRLNVACPRSLLIEGLDRISLAIQSLDT